MENKYIVKDSLGNVLREFYSYKAAYNFVSMNNRHDWTIIKF